MKTHVLIAEDDEVSCQLFAEVLETEGYQVDRVASGEEALARLHDATYDLLVIDVRMPGISGLNVTRVVHKEHPSLPIVVMTAFGSIETAIEAIREGAFDFISKPMNLEELKKTVARALARPEPRAWERKGFGELDEGVALGAIIGRSNAMVEVYKTVARAAPTKSTVLILGESGTGKELIARAIHQHSPRAARPFVAVDCGSLTETLLESELFGHIRGSFTGAVNDRKGVFEEAAGGTCFLDEIGDISANMQAKLLRVLQEYEVRRVGAQQWIKVDVRVVAATNKNLEELVRKGRFRKDLYYRLKVVSIYLPPIRERKDDIPSLALYFLKRYSQESGKTMTGITDDAMDRLLTYSWPGNIRELENAIERAVVLSNQSVLTADDLPVEVRENRLARPADGRPEDGKGFFSDAPTLEEVKRRYVVHVLGLTRGNISKAAEILDIDRRSLYRMLERYKVTPFSKQG